MQTPPQGPPGQLPPLGAPRLPGVGPPPAPGAFPGVAPQPGLPGGTPGQTPPNAGASLIQALKQAGIELPEDPAMEHRDLGRRSPRGAYDQVYEIVAHDLAEWLNKMPKILATAMRGGPHRQAPFKVAATGKQKYEIFKAKLFNDDGTANLEGRQELLRRMTPRQYAEVVHIVTRQMRREGGEVVGEPENE